MDNTLTVKLLPAALICKNFIDGMDNCNYEIYLREVVNASAYFSDKANGKEYTAPLEETHGEWDCISDSYSLDFKLLASETALRARNLFSGRIYKIAEGVTGYCASKIEFSSPRYKTIHATFIFKALRSLDVTELKAIRNSNTKKQGVNTDIKALLETLETQKNILLFFPYEFFTKTDNDFTIVISDIITVLSNDFSEAFKYRRDVAAQFDTYFVFIYAGRFVLTEICEGKMRFIGAINEMSSPTYMEIKSYTE